MRFHNRFKDYLRVSSVGLLVGTVALLIAFLPSDSLWSIPSIACMYGFWVVGISVLIWRSTSHVAAGLHVFLYLFFTVLAYYSFQFLLGFILPQFEGTVFQATAFLRHVFISLICGVAAVILYCWNHKSWYNAILLALPIGILTAETLFVLTLLQNEYTHLFQLLFNAGFCLYLGLQFRKMTYNKELYTVSVIVLTWLANRYIF